MDFKIGQIVWAKRYNDNIYWPGKITMKCNETNDLWSVDLFDSVPQQQQQQQQQQSNYLIQFFITNQTLWTTDIVPYRQYRESMMNHSFIQYGLHPAVKQDFFNAVYQADYNSNDETYVTNNYVMPTTTNISGGQQQKYFLSTFEDNTDNNILSKRNLKVVSNNDYYDSSYQATLSSSMDMTNESIDNFTTINSNNNQTLTTANDWYEQQGLLVESITPPLPLENNYQLDYVSSLDDTLKHENSIVIIGSRIYSNSSFISYIFNCFSNVFPTSIIYIEDLINYQHPNAYNIIYLISIDHFDSTIQYTFNSTILNNLSSYVNYLFLIINAPSYDLIKHFYSTIVDKQTILILQYRSTFDNDPLLLCSGNRTTFDKIQSSILKYLCSNIKYIESNGNENEQVYSAYCISSIIQSTNVLNNFINEQFQETLKEKFESDFLKNNDTLITELFPRISTSKTSNSNNLLELINHTNQDILTNKSKQSIVMNDLFESRAIKTHIPPPICEYYVQNILHEQ